VSLTAAAAFPFAEDDAMMMRCSSKERVRVQERVKTGRVSARSRDNTMHSLRRVPATFGELDHNLLAPSLLNHTSSQGKMLCDQARDPRL
jgi:hypothetical protein